MKRGKLEYWSAAAGILLAVVIVMGGVTVADAGGYVKSLSGTFTNGTAVISWTGSSAVGISAIDLASSASTNLYIGISNLTGYATIALTNVAVGSPKSIISYVDGDAPRCMRKGTPSSVVLTGGIAGGTLVTNSYRIYLKY